VDGASGSGFRAVDPTARGIDLGLIVQLELTAVQRLMQVAFELHALLRDCTHAFGVALHIIAASFLGAVHGGVGSRDQGVDGRPIAREERDADAGEMCTSIPSSRMEGSMC